MGNRRCRFWPLASVAALAAGYGQALAQTPGNAPTREEVLRRPPPSAAPASGSRVLVEGDMERGPCPLSEPAYAGLTITPSGAEFSNLQGIPADLLRPAYQAYIGRTVPLSAVCDIRDAATDMLRRKGYLAAVQVPAQRIEGGIVKFDLIVAKIIAFQVRGDAGKSEGRIAGYLAALKDQPVFNAIDAERTLLLMRDMPGYDIRLTLRPAGTNPGEMIGEVQVDYTPVQAELNVNNFSSRATGRIGGLAQLHYNGLFGSGDRTSLGFYSTADFKEQQVALADEELQVGHHGLTIGADVAYAWTQPFFGPGSDFKSRTFIATLQARYPLVRRQVRTILLSGGFDWIDQRARFGTFPAFLDKLRVAYARIDYDQIQAASIASLKGYSAAEPRWRIGGSLEIRQGLGILGYSRSCGPAYVHCFAPGVVPPSFFDADMTAFIARASGNLEFRPTRSLAFVLTPRAQFAPHALPAYEEYSAGTFTVGRGYDPGILTGDSGVGFTSEVRFGSLVPSSPRDAAFQGYGFLDSAWLWDKDQGTPEDPQRLLSAGGGIRAAIGDRFNLETSLAVPLKRLDSFGKRGDVRLLVNLTMRLLPWNRR
jgi:hemolysin activation/secretion protein